MKFLALIPLLREIVALGQTIADNVRARREARKAAAKPCPPPVPAKARKPAKQAPTKDGKR